jgi:formylmethanofuran dehydrogenase subunit B
MLEVPVVKAATCPICGCLCDDIELTVKNGAIVKVKNGCSMSEAKFLSYNAGHRILKPLIKKNGKHVPVSIDAAVAKAARMLAEASYPLLYGWSNTSCEAIRTGVELAEQLGGVLDNTSTVCHGPSELGVQEVGLPGCTLGQIRHRADLIIYWGSNPWSSHPRHIERYTSFSEGKFEKSEWKDYITKTKAFAAKKKVDSTLRRIRQAQKIETSPIEKGPCPAILKGGRKLIVVDVRQTRTAEAADYFIQIEPNKDYELIEALRSLVRDQELEVDKVAGVPVEFLEEVAEAMIQCSFGVIFFGLGLTMSKGKVRNVDAAISLVKDLNTRTKFAIMPMRGHFNVTGADTVFTWQTGYPFAVDFSLGYPRYNPGETSAVDVLLRKETDAALVVASDPVSNFPKPAAEHLVNNPLIVIDPHMNATSQMADVVFPSAFVGIETTGTVYRMDHVPLILKKITAPPREIQSDEEILKRILQEVRKIRIPRKEEQ